MPKRIEDLIAYITARGAYGPPDRCWLWTGAMHPTNGYGRISLRPIRSRWAHRAVYELLVGPIPDGLVLDHLCHTNDPSCPGGDSDPHRRCVNPRHLEPVTPAENGRRADPGARMRGKTHCPRRHPYSGANLYVEPSTGKRRCRLCYAATQKAYKQRVRSDTA